MNNQYVPALDYSGVVEEVGSEVTKVKAGDEVYGWTKFYNPGTLAEYTIIEESSLAKKPSNLSFAEAAAFPLVSLTAFQAFQTGGLKEGDKVLITAAAGGVGAHGIQVFFFISQFILFFFVSTNSLDVFCSDCQVLLQSCRNCRYI